MAALNKQQALAAQKKRTFGERDTSYGSAPGEITAGRSGSDMYYDPSTNTWQLKPEASNNINAYMDDILGVAGMKDAGTQSQGAGPGSAGGSGKGEGPGEAEGDGDQDDQKVVQESLNAGLPLEIIAGGLLGAGAAVIAQKLMKARGGNAAGAATSAAPDAAGTAVEPVIDPNKMAQQGQDVIDATFDDVLGIEGPKAALPPPETYTVPGSGRQATMDANGWPKGTDQWADATMAKGDAAPTPVDDPNLYRTGDSPRTDVGQGYPAPDPVAETIQNVEGGATAKLTDPLDENFANQLADMFAKQGVYDVPAVSPKTKGVNMAIMQRVRAILAGMRP